MECKGDVFTDITTFSITQQIFDSPQSATLEKFNNLELCIELLVFCEKLWVVKPTPFGTALKTTIPPILEYLLEEKIVEEYTPQYYVASKDFFKQEFSLVEKIISPDTLENYLTSTPEIQIDLADYDQHFQYSSQSEAMQLLKMVGRSDPKLIPLAANLIRTHMYIKTIHEVKNKLQRIVSYSPHFLRNSLIAKMCDKYRQNKLAIIHNILMQMETDNRAQIEAYNKAFGSQMEMDLPLLTTVVLSESENKDNIIDSIIDFRNCSDAKKIRGWFNEIQVASDKSDRKTLEENYVRLNKLCHELRSEESTFTSLSCIPTVAPDIIDGIASSSMGILGICGQNYTSAPTAIGGVQKLLSVIDDHLAKRDLALLINLKRKSGNVNSSRGEFERLFGVKFP